MSPALSKTRLAHNMKDDTEQSWQFRLLSIRGAPSMAWIEKFRTTIPMGLDWSLVIFAVSVQTSDRCMRDGVHMKSTFTLNPIVKIRTNLIQSHRNTAIILMSRLDDEA